MSEDASTTTHLQARNDDADSAIDDVGSIPTSDVSVESKAKAYIEENGRLYHADWTFGRYLLPNDEQERKRLRIQHKLLIRTDGGRASKCA
jgi:hypothetical protein